MMNGLKEDLPRRPQRTSLCRGMTVGRSYLIPDFLIKALFAFIKIVIRYVGNI